MKCIKERKRKRKKKKREGMKKDREEVVMCV